MDLVVESFACPCGLEGINCSELVPPLTDHAHLENDTCSSVGGDACIVKPDEVFCRCICGHKGDFCEIRVEPLNYNIALGFVIPLLVIAFCLWGIIQCERRDKVKQEWRIAKAMFSTSPLRFVSPRVLFIFRAFNACLAIITLIFEITRTGDYNLYTFSFWTFFFYAVMFFVGAIICAKSLRFGSAYLDQNRAALLEKSFLIMFEVIFSSSVFIALIVWGFLGPLLRYLEKPDNIYNPRSYIYHGVNVAMLFIEFMVDNLYFKLRHMLFTIVYGMLYLLFHDIRQAARNKQGELHCPEYSFFAWDDSYFSLWVLLLIVVVIIIYIILWILSLLKGWMYQKGTWFLENEITSHASHAQVDSNKKLDLLYVSGQDPV